MLATLVVLPLAATACSGTTTTRSGGSTAPRATPTRSSANAQSHLVWQPMAEVDRSGEGVTSVSCVSSSFCVAVDKAGNALTYRGSAWSAPQAVDPDGQGLESVSCSSVTFCAADDNAGNVLTYRGSDWSAPQRVATEQFLGSSQVSCASASFCLLVTNAHNTVTYNGTTWATSKYDLGHAPSAVACPSSSFCVGVINGIPTSGVAIYDGTTWGEPVTVDPSGVLNAVSCVSVSFCVAVGAPSPSANPSSKEGQSGHAFSYDGSSWSAPTLLGLRSPDASLNTISCTSKTFCVTAGSGLVSLFDGKSWSEPTQVTDPNQMGFAAVSCVSASFCVGITANGYAAIGRSG
jgi:hypothetical protein